MIRTLLIITGASLVLCVATLSGAAAIGGNELARHGWEWTFRDNDGEDHTIDFRRGEEGAAVTRNLAWTGGERLEIDVPGEVTYVQGAEAGVRVTGPKAMVDRVRLIDGRLTIEGDGSGPNTRSVSVHVGTRRWDEDGNPIGADGTLKITVTAPSINTFELTDSADLEIRNYDQPVLTLAVSGFGGVEATGRTDTVKLEISGSGEADLDSLTTRDAAVDISGFGDARVAATGKAEINVSGSGDVILTERPAELTQRVSGFGEVRQD
ncbi:GIN domain-containing protein [Brevundimonas sp. Root1423]|uniref:GIN domain-containing protein n=1 Tax=Brevundimonas sp. Root1423 TaxID=1736462 RepID=UPI0006F42CFD|nr:DUF2807 domain-containing protein [Brevundimonas sp. Root1423]KQY80497.1 hypothetical protein ASD25_10265 [Brevundimonas sp. Root1423]